MFMHTLLVSSRKSSLLLLPLLAGNYSLAHAETNAAPPLESSLEEIVVSSAFEGRKLGETILGASVLTKDELSRQLEGSLGETLKHQPGISSTFFGPGASRPIIRGLGGDRIRVLDFGLGSIDASATSPDHAVAVEPALAERIEILRGTAMLMYGSSAAGGVINVFDGRIPSRIPESGLEGAVRYSHNSVSNGDEAAASANVLLGTLNGASLVLHGDYSWRDTSDYTIPGFAESETLRLQEEAEHDEEEEGSLHDEEDEAFGVAENTATNTKAGSAGLSLVFDSGFFGINIKKLDSRYGVPGAHHHEEEHEDEEHGDEQEDEHGEEEEVVTIDLDQTRYDLHGEIEQDFGWFKKAKIRFGYADYEHKELEGDEIGTIFANEGWEGRLDLIEKGGENWSGATGFQLRKRDFSAIGAEAFVPNTTSTQYGVYTVKELIKDLWQFEIGARYEHTKHEVEGQNTSRSFNGISLSAGAGYNVSDNGFLGLSVFRTERAPTTEELFSNGPHLATQAFERGNLTLDMETALGLEATYTYATGPFSLVINSFYTSYDDFIFEAETGEEEDGLSVFEFRAADAELYGFETQAEIHLGALKSNTFGDIDWHLDGQLDYVRAKLTKVNGDNDLPRMPPLSALVGLEASTELFDARAEIEFTADQNKISEHELPTDGHVALNAFISIRPFKNHSLSLDIRGTNLTNTEIRQHTSFLKDLVPLPGRNVTVSLRAEF